MGKSKHEINHSRGLEQLCTVDGLTSIDEHPRNIKLIIKEPIYEKYGWAGSIECPDLFLGYYNHQWTVAELKNSVEKRDKACSQIESGKKMLVDIFGIPLRNISGKFVIYRNDEFSYEIV